MHDELDPEGPVCEDCERPAERCVCKAGEVEGQDSLFDPPEAAPARPGAYE